VTSGIDGVYPAGLAVATVTRVETKSSDAFAHIVCTPIAGIDRHKQLLILLVDASLPSRPPPEAAPAKNDKAGKISLDVRDKPAANKSDEKNAEKAAAGSDSKPQAAPAAPPVPSPPQKVAR
jgi:rod shape-determining protein MreC